MSRPRPLAELAEPCLGRALAAQGFSGGDIVLSWPEIAGERLSAASRPIKVEWPRRVPGLGEVPQPATLVIRVEGAFALEMQHLVPLLIERINAHYGWRCIGRIVMKQGPVRRDPPPPPPREADPAERRRVAEAVAPLPDGALRDALSRLGAAVLAAERVDERAPPTSLPQSS